MFGNLNSKVEKFDIQEIPDSERKQKPRSLFYLWFGSNLTVADFIIGSDYLYGNLSNNYMILALIIANAGGAALLAFMSILGPLKGRSQMFLSEGAYGKKGGKAMSLLQFINTGGWLTVNLIIAAYALSFLITRGASSGFSGSFSSDIIGTISIIVVAVIVFIIVFFGHSFIKSFEKAMSLFLGLMFAYIILSVLFFNFQDVQNANSLAPAFSWVNFGFVIMLTFSYIMSWGPYAADYSRYIPRNEKLWKSFAYTFLGGFLASIGAEIAGLLAADVFKGATTSDSLFFPVLGSLWFIGPIALFMGGIAANSLNLYSNFLSLKTIVSNAAKIPIIIAVSLGSIIMALIFYNSFSSYYEVFLEILDYWITPWIGVMIAEFLILKLGNHSSEGISWRVLIAYLISIAISFPFMTSIQYDLSTFGYTTTIIPLYPILSYFDPSYVISFASAIIITVIVEVYHLQFERLGKNIALLFRRIIKVVRRET
ncbi:MAG: purine-cytosine permease family protein [Thermoplasmataceae archaeon]